MKIGLNKFLKEKIKKCSFSACHNWKSRIKRTCEYCVFNNFYDLAFDYIKKNNISEFLINFSHFQGYCSILDEFKCFPLKKPCPHHAYKLWELPNPFFHNNHICPFCDKKVKKKDEKGRCRLQSGKQWQWYHLDCKRSSGINPIGFDNIKLKLML